MLSATRVALIVLRPCSILTGLVSPIGSDLDKYTVMVVKALVKLLTNTLKKTDTECLRFTRLRIRVYTGTSYNKGVKHREDKSRTKSESEQRQSWRSSGWSDARISRED